MNSASDKKIVLNIDDDVDDRELFEEAISRVNSEMIIRQAASGEKGLEFLRQAKQSGDLPCLIFLDMNMPGKGGRDVLSEIKEDTVLSSIPIIIFTTSSSELDK